MKVLLVTDSYPPLIGGATRAAQQLGRQLHRRGHQVAVATAWQRGAPAYEDDAGVHVHRVRGLVSRVPSLSADPVRYTPPPFPDPEMAWRLVRVIRRTRPDVIHSYGWITYSCLAALIGHPVPLVLGVRDYGNVCAVRTLIRHGPEEGTICSGPAWRKCAACSQAFYGEAKGSSAVISVLGSRRLLARRADALHSPSRFTERMIQRFLTGADALPSAVIPDFREDERLGPPDEKLLAQLPSEPFILYVGALRQIKGLQLLLQAYRQLAAPPPLAIIGSRTLEPMPQWPPGVVVLFDVPHDTVMAAWSRALFGVSPSVVPETLGNVVHEAMSRGKAVIGTRPGGHEDIIENGVNGLLVRGGDVPELERAMRRLIEDEPARRRMEAAARERAAAFTAEAVVPRFERLLADAVAAAQ